ncbi:MAG TPA: 3-oxoacyl-ACP synthase [Smithellaceae bacterium]|nr:3-oxoacyl-ACP synthase [Smithellaceae bacterium]
MANKPNVGIVAWSSYVPENIMTAADIAKATKGVWSEQAIIEKMGLVKKAIPGPDDGTQEMGVKAGLNCLKKFNYDPKKIDVILCVGEEWKEYPLTTSGIYIQEKIGATNAWAVDVEQKCCSFIGAMKMGKDMLIADDSINSVMIVGGYRNCDFLDYTDPASSMMFDLAGGGAAMIIEKNVTKNLLLGSHLITDGSLARGCMMPVGGVAEPITKDNLNRAYRIAFTDIEYYKKRLGEVSVPNWFKCIEMALKKSNMTKKDLGYLNILHIKHSMHKSMLQSLGLTEENSIYLSEYGHVGQCDQVLSLEEGLKQGRIKDGTVMAIIAAGIGYVWGAMIVKWGPE